MAAEAQIKPNAARRLKRVVYRQYRRAVALEAQRRRRQIGNGPVVSAARPGFEHGVPSPGSSQQPWQECHRRPAQAIRPALPAASALVPRCDQRRLTRHMAIQVADVGLTAGPRCPCRAGGCVVPCCARASHMIRPCRPGARGTLDRALRGSMTCGQGDRDSNADRRRLSRHHRTVPSMRISMYRSPGGRCWCRSCHCWPSGSAVPR